MGIRVADMPAGRTQIAPARIIYFVYHLRKEIREMILVISSSWSKHQSKEILKVAMQLDPIPDYMSRKMYVSSTPEVGVECFDMYEFDRSKLHEASEFLYARIQSFCAVEGFTYELKPWMENEEAIALVLDSCRLSQKVEREQTRPGSENRNTKSHKNALSHGFCARGSFDRSRRVHKWLFEIEVETE